MENYKTVVPKSGRVVDRLLLMGGGRLWEVVEHGGSTVYKHSYAVMPC